MTEPIKGGTRFSKRPLYREITPEFMRRLGQTLQEGHSKYSEGVYNSNWAHGDVEFFADCYDHAIEHLYAWAEGKTDEDHLAHAAANIMFMMYGQTNKVYDPSLRDINIPFSASSAPAAPIHPAPITETASAMEWLTEQDDWAEYDATTGEPPAPEDYQELVEAGGSGIIARLKKTLQW